MTIERLIRPHAVETAPRGQRRVANKARRTAALLRAARDLIEERESTDFTMKELAEAAQLSLATTYNIIGTKAAVLYALMEESLDALELAQKTLAATSPEDRLPSMIRLAVGFFASKPHYHRPLMRYLLGVYEPEKRPLFMARALNFWRTAAGGAIGPDHLNSSDAGDLAACLHLAFSGALDFWVHAEFDHEQFERAMLRQLAALSRVSPP